MRTMVPLNGFIFVSKEKKEQENINAVFKHLKKNESK